ncbi:MAG: serine hydrolase domain-containing protein [Bacteroidota bacterium]
MTVYEYLNSRFPKLGVPGLSCCISYQNKLSTFNFGYSDIATQKPIDDRSIFNIASIGKLITSACILKLVEKGTCTLNTCVGELLPEIPGNWKSVKISHLMSHSSGIPNYTDVPEYWKESHLDVPKQRILDYVKNSELDFESGSRWKYSNTGFYLLGLIIEKISGLNYFDFAKSLVASWKTGLEILKTDDRVVFPDKVTGYSFTSDKFIIPSYYSNSGTFSAGGFSARLQDFLDFETALFNGKILNASSLHVLITPFLNVDGSVLNGTDRVLDFAMTHGLFRFAKKGKVQVAHGGEILGYKSEYMRVVDDNFSVILATNADCNFKSLEMLDKVYDLTVTNT